MGVRIRMTLTIPKEILNFKFVQDEIAKAQRDKTAPEIKRLFMLTTQGWQHPPAWEEKQSISSSRISMTIRAAGEYKEQYKLVNYGSRPHAIRPTTPGGSLRFLKGYSPSTRPHILASRPYTRSGPAVWSGGVYHPGFSPRLFDEEVGKVHAPQFQKDMQDAIGLAAKVKRRQ